MHRPATIKLSLTAIVIAAIAIPQLPSLITSPICTWCKRVRDGRGYWSQIDAYLAARTDTQVTHGICPECNDKLLAEDSTPRKAQSSRR